MIPNRNIATVAIALLFSGFSVRAENFYVTASGSDAGSCTSGDPCATLSRACTAANSSPARVANINIAPGTYKGGCNITYHRLVAIVGTCSDASLVEVALSGNEFAFQAQDNAIMTVQCLSVTSSGTQSIGFGTRQFGLMDISNVRIGQFAMGYPIRAQEMSKINCSGQLDVYGEAHSVVNLGGKSMISFGCTVSMIGSPTFVAFASVAQGSLLDAGTATYFKDMRGQKYLCDNSEISGVGTMPGIGRTVTNGCIAR